MSEAIDRATLRIAGFSGLNQYGAGMNADASCAESEEEALALWFNLNANDGLIIEHTSKNTDKDEWSSLCGKLDLSRENNVRRILEKKSRGLIVCLSQDFDFRPAND